MEWVRQGHHLDMMADIHFCSSFLRQSVEVFVDVGSDNSPVEMEQHPQYGDQLLLIILVLLLQELQQDILQVHIVNGSITAST